MAHPKTLFRERREPSRRDDVHLTPSQHLGVLPQAEYMKRTGSKVVLNLSAPDNMKHVEPNDFVAHLRSFQGGIEKSSLRGKVSTAYTVMSPLPEADPGFYRWALKSGAFISELAANCEQLRDGQSVKFGDFVRIRLPHPPLEEQRRIADFLDDRVARIDQIIAARRAQIRSLIASDEAVLNAALTTTPQRVRAGRVLRVLPGFAFPSGEFSASPSDVPLLRGINVGVGQIRWKDAVYWPRDRVHEVRDFLLRTEDVVMGMDRPWIGDGLRIAQLTSEDEGSLLLQRVAKLLPGPEVLPEFTLWAYRSQEFRDQIESDLTGLSVPHLSGDQILAYRMPFGTLAEQQAVVERMREHRASTDAAAEALNTSIGLLAEYKQSLITAAVSGELDVSTATSEIPG